MIKNLPNIRGEYRFNQKLINWFDVGGTAETIFRPADIGDLSYFFQNRSDELAINIIGNASNIIIKDAGISGVTIKLGREFSKISHYQENGENLIKVGAGNLCLNIALYCQKFGFTSLEFLSGIPGSIGGAVAMNAGCYGYEVSNVLRQLTAIDYLGNLHYFNNHDCKFIYRKNQLIQNEDLIVVEAIFAVEKCDSAIVNKNIKELQFKREESQPIRAKTGGSTFKNPNGYKAWQLIDEAGCRGMTNGDAQISVKHCNFMINNNKATAKQLIDLGNEVRSRVLAKTGINLEWEIKII